MEDMNVVTATQEEVGALQESAEEVSATEGTETAEVEEVAPPAPPQAFAKPVQTAEEAHDFKMRRIQAEQKAEKLESAINMYRSTFRSNYGFPDTMTDQEIVDVLTAQAQQKTPDQVRKERETAEAAVKERLKTDPEYLTAIQQLEEYKKADMERQFSTDLSEIKGKYPDEKAASVYDFGNEFLQLCANGVRPIVAYEAIRNNKKQAAPPSIGDVAGETTKEKDFYTPEEVDRLSDKDYDNPKIMEIVRKSMTKWK